MVRHPPDILITTPESLYLMLTSQAREIFERHRVGDRRRDPRRRPDQARRAPRAHARAARRGQAEPRRPAHRPVRDAEPARGGRPLPRRAEAHVHGRSTPACASRSTSRSTCRSSRWSSPTRARTRADLDPFAGGEATRKSIWPAIYPEILAAGARAPLDDRVRQQPPRRGAARAAAQRAGRGGDRARPPRLAGARGAAGRRGPAEGGRAAVPGRDLVAGARHRHGRGRPRAPGRVAEVGHRRAPAHRPRRPQRRRDLEGPHLPEVPRRPARVRGRRAAHARGADRDRPSCRATRSTCSPSRSWRSRPRAETRRRSTTCTRWSLRTHTYAELSRAQLENVLDMLDGRYPSEEFGELRPRIVWDRVAGTIRARKGSRALAITNAGTIPDRGLFSRQPARRPPRRRARRGDGLRGAARPGLPARRDVVADRGDHPRPRRRHARRPACPGAVPFWKGDCVGRPRELGEAIGAFSRWAVDQDSATLERDYDLDAHAAGNLLDVPARAGGGDARRPERAHDRDRALPRRDRRLAPVHPLPRTAGACTRPGGWR